MSYTLYLDHYKNDLVCSKKTDGIPSRVGITFFGDEGTIIPAGTRVRDKKYLEQWETNETVMIQEHIDAETEQISYYASVECYSVNKGRFSVESGDIDELIRQIEGVDSVTNTSTSIPGSYPKINFNYISGTQEVCQRVRILLQHQFSEYFLNRLGGIPYYRNNEEQIKLLGSKNSDQIICNILRKKIMNVPGVLQVKSPSISKIGRQCYFSCSILVDGENEISFNQQYEIANLQIGGV